MPRSPKKGDIYWAEVSDPKERPCMVLTIQALNGGSCVTVAPFTTQKIDQRLSQGYRQYVEFLQHEFGLPYRCLLQLDQVTVFPQSELRQSKYIGTADDAKLVLVDRGIAYSFGLEL